MPFYYSCDRFASSDLSIILAQYCADASPADDAGNTIHLYIERKYVPPSGVVPPNSEMRKR